MWWREIGLGPCYREQRMLLYRSDNDPGSECLFLRSRKSRLAGFTAQWLAMDEIDTLVWNGADLNGDTNLTV